MAAELVEYIEYLESVGVYDVALPFLLVFTITYGVLQKINIFGKGRNPKGGSKFNSIIALVIAFFTIRAEGVVETMNTFLPNISLIAILVVSFLLLVGIVAGRNFRFSKHMEGAAVLILVIGVGVTFFGSSGALGLEFPSWLDIEWIDFTVLFSILIGGAFIAFVTSDGNTSTGGKKHPFRHVLAYPTEYKDGYEEEEEEK
jgi:hypothetical protein